MSGTGVDKFFSFKLVMGEEAFFTLTVPGMSSSVSLSTRSMNPRVKG